MEVTNSSQRVYYRFTYEYSGTKYISGYLKISNTPSPVISAISVPEYYCEGTNITIIPSATVYYGSKQYRWTYGSSTSTASSLTVSKAVWNASAIQLKVTDGCGQYTTETNVQSYNSYLPQEIIPETVYFNDNDFNFLCEGEAKTITAQLNSSGINTSHPYTLTWKYETPTGAPGLVSQLLPTAQTPPLNASSYTSTLSVTTNSNLDLTGYKFYCSVDGFCHDPESEKITVTQKQPVTLVSFSAPDTACMSSQITLQATATGSDLVYKWTGSSEYTTENTATYTMPSSGMQINCEIKNQYGHCVKTIDKDVYVNVYSTPSLRIIDPVMDSCKPESIIIRSEVTGGMKPLQYFWSPGGITSDSIVGIPGNTYTLDVRDGCNNTSSESVSTNSIKSFNAVISKNDITCFGKQNGEISISASGGSSPYTYSIEYDGITTTSKIENSYNTIISDLPKGEYIINVSDFCQNIDISESIRIEEPDELYANINDYANVSCYGLGDGEATVSASGGTPPYVYNWDNGQRTQTAIGLSGRTYSVYVFDKNNCNYQTSVDINEPMPLEATISSTNVECHADTTGSIIVTASNGVEPYQYIWSNGEVTNIQEFLPAGLYTVTVTDQCDDSFSFSKELTEPDSLFIASTIYDVECFGEENGIIETFATGGSGNLQYKWSNGAASTTLYSLAAGTYTLTVADACLDSIVDSFAVQQPELLTLSADVENTSCYGMGDGEIKLHTTGGVEPFTFIWKFGNIDSIIPNLYANEYQFTVFDLNGCRQTEQFTVTEPSLFSATLYAENISCFGDSTGLISISTMGGVEPYSYIWSNDADSPQNDGLTAGLYEVTVSDLCNTSYVFSKEIIQPDSMKLMSSIYDISCYEEENGIIEVSVSGGTEPLKYAWSNEAEKPTLYSLDAGEYTLTVSDACSDTLIESFTLIQPERLTLTADLHNPTCNGDGDGSIDLITEGGTEPYTIIWRWGEVDEVLTNLFSGTYQFSVYDAKGCSISESFILENPEPLSLTLTTTGAECNMSNGSISVDVIGGVPPFSYNWNGTEDTQQLNGIDVGEYSLTITDASGCTLTTSAEVGTKIDVVDICMVTVDEEIGLNKVVWEYPGSKPAGFNIYQWNSGEFVKIGYKDNSGYSVYNDVLSNPTVRASRYAISTVDQCGNESELSPYHQTILATSNQSTEPNTANIIWSEYIDESGSFIPAKYYIYKGTDVNNLLLYDSVSTGTVFVDHTRDGAIYYRVAAKKNDDCISDGALKSDSGPYSQSVSNICKAELIESGLDNYYLYSIQVSPNPSSAYFTITGINDIVSVEIFNNLGQTIYSSTIAEQNSIDCSNWVSGSYWIAVEGQIVEQLIVH